MAGDVTVAVVSGQIATGTGSPSGEADFTKSGFGTPKACIILVGWDTIDDANVVGQSKISIGFSDFTNDYCITHQDENASAKVDCDALKSNTKSYVLLDTASSVTVDGTAATITDGVRLTNTTASFGRYATVIMFGGADLAISLQSSAINSSQDGTATITHSGFTDVNDKLIFFIGSDISGEDSASSGINNSFGVCHATGSDAGGWTFAQRCMGWASDHNAAEANPAVILRTAQVIDIRTEIGAEDWGLEVTGLDHSPAEWTVTTRNNGAGANMEVYSLALDLDDRSAKVGSVDSPVSGSTWTPSVSLGFTPQYVGLALTDSANENSVGLGASLGISSNTGSGEETCHTWYNESGAATTNTNNLFRSRAIDIRDGDVTTVIQDHSHSSFDSGGWTYTINTENEDTTRKWFYWTIEEAAVGATIITVPTTKAFSLTSFLPTIETGVNVAIPVPKSYSLTKLTPAAGTSVLVTTPAPKGFSLSKLLPTIETGVAIIVPAPKTYSLAGQLPIIGSGVNIIVPVPKSYSRVGFEPTITVSAPVEIIVPAPKAYTLNGQLPTIETGVTIITPLGTFTLAGFDPTIETGVTIIVPAPKSYTLNGFDPLISIGVNIIVPTPKGYSLSGFDPEIASGVSIVIPLGSFTRTGFEPGVTTLGAVEIIVPLKAFNLTKFAPNAGAGVIVTTPLGTFTLTGFDPTVNIGVNIITPLGTFNLTKFDPVIGTGVDIAVPLGSFTRTNFDPSVASGVGIVVPLQVFTRTGFILQIGTGATVIVPVPKAYTLTGFEPFVEKVVEIRVGLKIYSLDGFVPIIHSNRPPFLAADILDLTPPFEDIDQIRYLIRNFAVLRDLLEAGIDGQFTTSDGKTALVRGGVIVDLY